MTYLVFETLEIAEDILNQINVAMHKNPPTTYWDEIHYNEWVEKWWMNDPYRRLSTANKPIVITYRQELEDSWFSNPDPEPI